MAGIKEKRRNQLCCRKRRQILHGADIRGTGAEKMHVKNISLGAKRLSGCHGDCVQQRRRDEDEIARGNVIVLQLDLIGAAPGENARKFRFLVPVCADGRVQIVECGDIFLQWKKLFTVPGVFLLLRRRNGCPIHVRSPDIK